ncbi:MAG: ChbG/HpnK family deacetylase [Bacteroidaceae bacterium]|nr:ChbG/HpnK family deacetylase [Bacteroidaceae bacterium]
MTKVILNADDFGKSLSRNRAINDSFKQGLIYSAGLIVTGKHLQNAIDYMMEGKYVESTHLHVNLSANLLQEDSEDAPLTDAMRKDPFFCKDGKFKKYKGLPHRISDIRKWKIVYEEIVAQYNKFFEETQGRGNIEHVDFHLWYNLTFPVALALNFFTWKYKIKSVRYIGIHQKSIKFKLFRWLSWNPRVKSIPATNIDYYLSKRRSLAQEPIIELYCHPNYKEEVFLDDSPSYLKHERQPMQKQIQMLKELDSVEFISWESIK